MTTYEIEHTHAAGDLRAERLRDMEERAQFRQTVAEIAALLGLAATGLLIWAVRYGM